MFRAKAAGRPWPGGQGLGDGRLEVYIDENNGIDHELVRQIMGMKVVCEGGGNSENRKMFSHRELTFPIARAGLKIRICLDRWQELGEWFDLCWFSLNGE